jgi:hypothetical protein
MWIHIDIRYFKISQHHTELSTSIQELTKRHGTVEVLLRRLVVVNLQYGIIFRVKAELFKINVVSITRYFSFTSNTENCTINPQGSPDIEELAWIEVGDTRKGLCQLKCRASVMRQTVRQVNYRLTLQVSHYRKQQIYNRPNYLRRHSYKLDNIRRAKTTTVDNT